MAAALAELYRLDSWDALTVSYVPPPARFTLLHPCFPAPPARVCTGFVVCTAGTSQAIRVNTPPVRRDKTLTKCYRVRYCMHLRESTFPSCDMMAAPQRTKCCVLPANQVAPKLELHP